VTSTSSHAGGSLTGLVWTGDLEVRDDIVLRPLRSGEVRVRIEAAGLCHSDVSVVNGDIPFPTPVVLGHEGAGVVVEVSEGVRSVSEGDHVVLTTLGHCGSCAACDRGEPTHCRSTMGRFGRPFEVGGEKAFQFANTGVFCQETIVLENQAVVIPDDVPFTSACLVGCGVVTGVGAVLNRARVRPGETVVVIGTGGIGLNVLQGASIAAAGRIVAVDTNPDKEVEALRFGATDFVDASARPADGDTVAAVEELLPDGADHVFECVGSPALIRQAIGMLDWGGNCVIVGVPKLGSEASFVVNDLYNDRSIMGCRYGTTRPHHDIPMLLGLYRQGRLKLDELVSRTYALHDVSRALDDLHAGELNRGVFDVANT
jgi:Zn-dependent alcohol dehydrogenase